MNEYEDNVCEPISATVSQFYEDERTDEEIEQYEKDREEYIKSLDR